MKPLPLVSAEVSILPLWLRSMHSERSLAILVTDDWPPKARLEMKRSPLKSTEVRDGALEVFWIAWWLGSGILLTRAW